MTEKEHHPLVPTSSGSLTRATDGPDGIFARMSSDVLEIVRAKDRALEQARFRIGDYEFRGPDYRQICRWAEALGRSPEYILEVLEGAWFEHEECNVFVEFSVVDGCLSSLVWDFDQLPLDVFAWEDGVRVQTLAFSSDPPTGSLPRTLPSSLQTLVCLFNRLVEVDLSSAPDLKILACQGNALEKLDLSCVSGLTELYCQRNAIRELDLSVVPKLTKLNCAENHLTVIDLSGMPELVQLDCSHNLLTELNLSVVQKLKYLECSYNHLTELDLSGMPWLTELACKGNPLTTLDLSGVPELTYLIQWADATQMCNYNVLTDLDIRPLSNLHLLWVSAKARLIGTPPAGCRVVRV